MTRILILLQVNYKVRIRAVMAKLREVMIPAFIAAIQKQILKRFSGNISFSIEDEAQLEIHI